MYDYPAGTSCRGRHRGGSGPGGVRPNPVSGAANNKTPNSSGATGSTRCLHGFTVSQDGPEGPSGPLVSLQRTMSLRLIDEHECHPGYGIHTRSFSIPLSALWYGRGMGRAVFTQIYNKVIPNVILLKYLLKIGETMLTKALPGAMRTIAKDSICRYVRVCSADLWLCRKAGFPDTCRTAPFGGRA